MSVDDNSEHRGQSFDDGFFQRIVEHNLDMTTVIGPGGRIIYQSPAIERLLGYSPDKSAGITVFDVVHPDDLEQTAAVIKRLTSGAVAEAEAELRFRHTDGSYRHIHAVGHLAQQHPEPMVVVTSRDITAQHKAMLMLTNNNELLSRIFSVSQNMLSITLPETGEFIDVNDSWCTSLEYVRDEVIGRTATELGVWGSQANRDKIIHRLNTQGYLTRYPTQVYTRSGNALNVLVDAQYLTVAEGTRIVMSTQDITESRLIEDELRQAQKMESLGQLTGGVAHDFNNLLGVVMGNAELLLAVEEHPRKRRYAQQILDATLRGADLTQQLLAFSRRQTLKPEKVSVQTLLQNMQVLLQTTVTENTRITYNLDAEAALCTVDPGQLESAILNLTLNARDAMPHGGNLVFTVRQVDYQYDQYSPYPGLVLPDGPYVLLELRDSGHGMDEATRKRAVEPFFTTKDVGKGTGLGLSMVYGFVDQSGGGMHIDSSIDVGTTVSLLLPLNEPGTHHQAVPSHLQHDLSKSEVARGVLVIEDNEPLRNLIVLYLQEAGFQVRWASGESDVPAAMAQMTSVDLLVSDIVLQGPLSGPELARRIARQHPDMRTLFITGYSRTENVDGPLLQKPFTRNDFIQAVLKLF